MVIPNINSVDRDFIYLSNMYKCIEQFEVMGHQAGRKIGDMLELITMGKVYEKPELLNRLSIEPKLLGQTTAEHKVEFAFLNTPTDFDSLFGFIECKKVGVEATKNRLTKRSALRLGINDSQELSYSNQWLDQRIRISYKITEINDNNATVEVKDWNGEEILTFNILPGQRFRIALTEEQELYVIPPTENLTTIEGVMRVCQLFILEKIEDNSLYWRIFDCLPGPQTPEKAKQASLVAMDVRRRIDGQWGKENLTLEQRNVTSILVIGEFSHWEAKSRNMVITCIDYNLVVPDEVLIYAFNQLAIRFNNNWDLISKNVYRENEQIRNLIAGVINHFEGKVFFDITTKRFVDFRYENGKLIVFDMD